LKSGAESIRAFISVGLPDPLLENIASLRERLQRRVDDPAIRWSPHHQLHITLRFLGNVAIEAIPTLEGRLREIGTISPPFELRAESVGCFPSPRRPRVLWVGLKGDLDKLEHLVSQIDLSTREIISHEEERSFRPHITIGRIQPGFRRGSDLTAVLDEERDQRYGHWNVVQIHLMQSRLGPGGAKHLLLAAINLGGSSSD
jgi:2'-5' RNA ligase